jgi:hypothetical protein
LCVLLFVFQAALRPLWSGWVASMRPQWQGQGSNEVFDLFAGDLGRLLLLTVLIYGSIVLVLTKNFTRWLIIVGAAIAIIFELNYFDHKLIHPTTPDVIKDYLAADDVVEFLKKDTEPFRVLPVSNLRNPDWYMSQRIESVYGYTGAKPRLIQEGIDSLTFGSPLFLKLLNTKYLLSDRPMSHPDLELVFTGRKEQVYRFIPQLPRAYLVGRTATASKNEIFSLIKAGSFDFGKNALLDKPLNHKLDENGTGQITWKLRQPDHFALDLQTQGDQFLVLSEPFYPSGWKATLDGQPVEIFQTDYLFRGIYVPGGQHTLEMTYRPESLGKGNMIKWIGVLLILAGLASGFLSRRKSVSRVEG